MIQIYAFSSIEFLDVGSVFLTTHNHTKLVEDNVFFLQLGQHIHLIDFLGNSKTLCRIKGEVAFPLKH